MSRATKRKLTTVIGCVLGAVTLTGPLAGQLTFEYQCRHGLCDHPSHRRDRFET